MTHLAMSEHSYHGASSCAWNLKMLVKYGQLLLHREIMFYLCFNIKAHLINVVGGYEEDIE